MNKYGYQGNSNHTIFIKNRDGKVTLLIIYVKNMVVRCDDVDEIGKLHKYLAPEFEMNNI